MRDIDGNITGIHWYKDKVAYKGGLEARVTAKATIAHPDWSAKLVAQILEGVIQDGGGTEVLGGHLVRVPPRQPVEAILAGLPPQLVQRLTPVLERPPQGEHPEQALRQQLSHAVAQYQKESRA